MLNGHIRSCSSFRLHCPDVQLLSHIWLFVTLWAAACQASLSFIISWSLLKLMSIESGMPSNHLCCPFLLLLSIFPSIRVFQMSHFFASGGQSIGVSASASVLSMNIQDWCPLGCTGWISLQSKVRWDSSLDGPQDSCPWYVFPVQSPGPWTWQILLCSQGMCDVPVGLKGGSLPRWGLTSSGEPLKGMWLFQASEHQHEREMMGEQFSIPGSEDGGPHGQDSTWPLGMK